MLTRRTKKLTKSQVVKVTGRKYLLCSKCESEEILVSNDIGKVICPYCVQTMVAPPENYTSHPKSDKPRGWHFKKYFEHDGVVYSRGKEITDKKEIAALKKEANNATDSVTPEKVPKKRKAMEKAFHEEKY
jgi:ribosomal protein S27E